MPVNHDPLADGLFAGPGVVDDQIVVEFAQHVVPEGGAGLSVSVGEKLISACLGALGVLDL